LGNFGRLDAVLDCFQAKFGIGTKITQARIADVIQNGYPAYGVNVRESNIAGLAFQKQQLAKARGMIISEKAAKITAMLGIKDLNKINITIDIKIKEIIKATMSCL